MKRAARALLGALNAALSPLGWRLLAARKGSAELFDLRLLRAYHEDNDIRRLYREAIERCGGQASDNIYKQFRFYAYAQLAAHAARALPDKDFAECGCWKGHSTRMIAATMRRCGSRGRLLVFDSFEGGLSEFSREDDSLVRPMTAEEKAAQRLLFRSTQEEVRANLSEFEFVDLFPGWIPKRFAENAGRSFAFVNIDVDLAAPVRDSIEFFYPRLAPGGIMIFDEYGYTCYPGVKTEVDRYLAGTRPSFFLELPTGGAFLIK